METITAIPAGLALIGVAGVIVGAVMWARQRKAKATDQEAQRRAGGPTRPVPPV